MTAMSLRTTSAIEQARSAARMKMLEIGWDDLAEANDAVKAADTAMRVLLTELRTTAQAQEGRTEAYEAVMDQIDGALAELRP